MSRFLTGLLMGVGLGVLLAPEKGADTRESLAETAGNLKDKVNRMMGRAGARVDDLRSMLENEVDGLSEDVRSRIRTILDEEGGGVTSGGRAASNGNARSATSDLTL